MRCGQASSIMSMGSKRSKSEGWQSFATRLLRKLRHHETHMHMDIFSVQHCTNRLPIDGFDHQTIAANCFLLDSSFFYVSSYWLVQRFKVGYWYVQFGQEVYWHWCIYIVSFYLPPGSQVKVLDTFRCNIEDPTVKQPSPSGGYFWNATLIHCTFLMHNT